MADRAIGNVCQYWRTDEPGRCSHWDAYGGFCTYVGPGGAAASYFPFCNLLGTITRCDAYNGTGTQECCVLPDPTRHVVNRSDGKKWLEDRSVDESGLPVSSLDYSRINGYNDGKCDGFGTNTVCSGFSPYILQFGVKLPDDKYGTLGVDAETLTPLSGVRLPLNYEIYNRRAVLGKCYFWGQNPLEFTVDSATSKVVGVDFKCTQADEVVQKYSKFSLDKVQNMYVPPCNGCKPECPHYTCTCWEYCVDSKTKQGDKVLAEQILELRWKIRKDAWTSADYYQTFEDPEIYAWLNKLTPAPVDSSGENQVLISAARTYINNFETFEIDHSNTTLTEGLNADDYTKRYPTLVKRLKDLPLAPIIRNKFDKINGVDAFITGDINHSGILLFGDTFYSDAEVYAVNLSDPELNFLPIELKKHASMYDIEKALGNNFESFYNDFVTKFTLLQYLMPEKLSTSALPIDYYMFYIDVPTFWGENKIIVLSKIKGRWEYSSKTIYKPYTGGIVGQTSFTIDGDGGTVSYLPAYDNDFSAYTNKNGSISFKFFPMTSDSKFGMASVAYAYIDGVRERLPVNPAYISENKEYEFTYKLYKIELGRNIQIDYSSMRFFGNAGYGFVFLSDYASRLTSLFLPWEIDGSLFLIYPDGTRCEMEIYEKCTGRLPIDGFTIRPKDINTFKMVCRHTFLSIEKLYNYERRTFTSSGEGEVIRESFLSSGDSVQYRTNLKLSSTGDRFDLTGFGYEPLMAAVVYRGPDGRIIGQTKTKLLTFVRQPYCRDVEIFYSWKSLYKTYTLLPEHECYGGTGEKYTGNTWIGYTPKCGDHQRSYFTGLGPLWYPYNDCDSYARYNYNSFGQFDIRIMDPFWDGVTHGQDDMRMLGPADHFGFIGESHAHLWACLCDYSYSNADKIGDNIFSGYAYYRGGLDEMAKRNCVRNDGALPRFGNVYRDFLNSFRSMDNVDYYYWNGVQFMRRRKWVPIYEFYSPNFAEPLENYPYKLYACSDYTTDNSTFLHPFGCLVANGNIEGVPISEQIDMEAGVAKRYRFEQIFRTHYSLAGLSYPMPKDPEQYLVGGTLIDAVAWYTYKNYPGTGGSSKSIQWAWQEYWKAIEHQPITSDNLSYFSTTLMGNHSTTDRLPITLTMAPYIGEGDTVTGRHAFLRLAYPNYRYDGTLKEHRLVCNEGVNTIKIIPPESSMEMVGSYGDNPIWHVQLNNGPPRCFDSDGQWVAGDDCNDTLYTICTNDPWISDVTLFDTGYDSTSPDPDRTITHHDTQPPTYEYYQRGLNVSILPGSLGFLPRRLHQCDSESYEMRVSPMSTCDDGESQWAAVEDVTKFYPSSTDFNVAYCAESENFTITFKFSYPMSLAAVGINFGFGAEKDEDAVKLYGEYAVPSTVYPTALYHLPGMKIYRSDDDVVYTPVYDIDSMKLATKTDGLTNVNGFYEFPKTANLIKPVKYLKIIFRVMPSNSEVDAVGGDFKRYVYSAINKVFINYLYIYYNEFLEAKESITTYERMYNISWGYHGDFPPHGYDSTGSLLYVLPNDKSTVYQMDSIGGVVGMPNSAGDCKSINKARGRIMKACHPDKERLAGSDLESFEKEQKIIHDDIAMQSGYTSIYLSSISPPNMSYLFEKAGVNFPSWTCTLTNTLVAPLAPVYAATPYSPCGHTYARDSRTARWFPACGKVGSIFGRIAVDTFDEPGFRLVCGGDEEIYWTVDVLGTPPIGIFSRLLLGIRRQYDRADEVNARTRAAALNRNLSKYSYPGPVDALY